MKRSWLALPLLLAAARCACAGGDPAALVSQAKRLDWAEVFAGPERLIYLGERHVDPRPKNELAAPFRKAAAAGVTHLAMEMLGQDRRRLLADSGSTEAELAEAFSHDWGPERAGFLPREYARAVVAAREAGLRVVPLDMDPAKKELGWKACRLERNFDECEDEELHARDDHMGGALARLLGEPGTGRVLAWTGGWHACRLEQAAGLAAKGLASRSYFVITRGGGYESETDIAEYQRAVDAQGRGGERLLIATGAAQACFDGLICLP